MKPPKLSPRLKTNQNFSGQTEKGDKGNSNSINVKNDKKRNISHKTNSRTVNDDLAMSSYVRSRCNLLTARSRVIRFKRCPKLLNHLKNKGNEKIVYWGQNCKPSEYVSYCLWPINWLSCDAEKKPASVMFLQPPHYIKAGLIINTADYLNIIIDILLPWIHRYYNATKLILIQDSVPSHGGKQV